VGPVEESELSFVLLLLLKQMPFSFFSLHSPESWVQERCHLHKCLQRFLYFYICLYTCKKGTIHEWKTKQVLLHIA